MRKFSALLFVVTTALWFSISSAFAEKRIALVVGNSAYTRITPLTNPKNDALLMSKALKESGFEVITAIDVDVRHMGRAIRKFGKALRAGGDNAVGLFYYAGHGIQSKGVNYLVPLNAEIEAEADLDLETISSSDILAQMEDAGNSLNLIILDACRNNPFKGKVRAAGRGLARIKAASGSLVAFAAGPGQVASDGKGINSPYTLALAKQMKIPGQTIERTFKNVRISVEKQTGKQQTPWEESSLKGDFYFTKAPASASAPSGPTNTFLPPIQHTRSNGKFELEYWKSVKDSTSPEVLQSYLIQYPNGQFSALANVLIQQLKDKKKFALASPTGQSNARINNPTGPAVGKLNACDLYAANPSDPAKVGKGVAFKNLNTVVALPACIKALNDFPGEDRYTFLLGRVYDKNRDLAEAYKLYRRAAENGYIQAMSNLGLMFKKGHGVSVNYREAAHWYHKAILGGSATAMHNTAILYDKGLGVKRNPVKAAAYVYQAIRSGYGFSSTQLTSNDQFWSVEFWQEFQKLMRNDSFYNGPTNGIVNAQVRSAVIKVAKHQWNQ